MGGKPRVVVAMSGGVDSSLTAALLVHQGYDVIGATMQIWEQDRHDHNPDSRSCCSIDAVDDARRVANKLGIPYYVLNFRDMFQATVVDYFMSEYSAGRTPNPCIACNRYVKFEGLLARAQALGAEYVATGHYARIMFDAARQRYILCKGIDPAKDQSYALYHLNQRTLRHFLMPLGGYAKTETRRMAKEWGLSVADKPDSQEICFVPNDDYKAYLKDRIPAALKPGNIVDTAGRTLGQHQGVQLYTVGQRKGLGLAVGKPLYVVALDAKRNEVVVGSDADVFSRELIASDLNFITIDTLDQPLAIEAKIRYSALPAPATLSPLPDDRVKVTFTTPQRAITPGQSVVFYHGNVVVGGGIILSTVK